VTGEVVLDLHLHVEYYLQRSGGHLHRLGLGGWPFLLPRYTVWFDRNTCHVLSPVCLRQCHLTITTMMIEPDSNRDLASERLINL